MDIMALIKFFNYYVFQRTNSQKGVSISLYCYAIISLYSLPIIVKIINLSGFYNCTWIPYIDPRLWQMLMTSSKLSMLLPILCIRNDNIVISSEDQSHLDL